jgi:hypothetical protein
MGGIMPASEGRFRTRAVADGTADLQLVPSTHRKLASVSTTMSNSDFALEPSEFENGRGFVVVRRTDGQRLSWQTLPRSQGLESINVVGERFRPEALQDPGFAPGCTLTLKREPENLYDSNAISVWNANGTLMAGYLPREDAKRIAKRLDKAQRIRAISIWETTEAGRRIGVRVLLLREDVHLAGTDA